MSNFTKSMTYQFLSRSVSVSSMIKRTIKEYLEVDLDKIASQMISMEEIPLNRYAAKLMQGNSRNQIKLMTAGDTKIVSTALPFATYRANNSITTMVYLDNFAKITSNKVLSESIPFFSVLGAAAIANKSFDSYGELTNKDIMIPTMNVYVDMVLGIFNILVHARADKKLSDIITYGARRFFLRNMLDIQDYAVETIAIKGLENISQEEYIAAKEKYDNINVDDGTFEKWIKWSQSISPKTKGINEKLIIEKWIRQYGEYSYFGLDNVEYLIGAILMTLGAVPGFSRSLQALIKNTKTVSKLKVALYSFGE